MTTTTWKDTLVKYSDFMVVIAAILNIIKFALNRDASSLRTIALIGGVSFIAFAVYLNFFAHKVANLIQTATN